MEKAVVDLGRYTEESFESAPAPEGDGEELVIQFDFKATPTANEEELEKRRQKRDRKEPTLSPRHRGRQKRARRSPKKRRQRGDKSKNGRAAAIATMSTLKRGKDENGKLTLLCPINKRVYASYTPKRHPFAVARHEADKRGFTRKSRKKIRIVIDGDEDLARLAKDFFPGATPHPRHHARSRIRLGSLRLRVPRRKSGACRLGEEEAGGLLYTGRASPVMIRI